MSESGKKNWLTPHIERFKKTKVGKVLVSLVVICSFIGGLAAGIEKGVEGYKKVHEFFSKDEQSDFKVRITILNARDTPIEVKRDCTVDTIETLGHQTPTQYSMNYPLHRIGKTGNDIFIFNPHAKQDYYILMPNLPVFRDMLEHEATKVKASVLVESGGIFDGELTFTKQSLRKDKLSITIR